MYVPQPAPQDFGHQVPAPPASQGYQTAPDQMPHLQQGGHGHPNAGAPARGQPPAAAPEPHFQAQPFQAGREPYRPDPGLSHQQQPGLDPSGYDFANYAVPPASAHQARHHQPAEGVNWPPEPPGFHTPAHPQQGYAAEPGYGADPHYAPEQADQDVELEDDYEYEDEPRGGRRWLIVAALVGSIGIGGAMAYGYKMLLGPSAGVQQAQVVKASRDPVRIAPTNPGGKQFAKSDDKFMNRLPSSSGGEVASAGSVDSSGVRRVPTVRVGPDLAVAPPAVADVPSAGGPALPGMTIVGGEGVASPPRPPASAAFAAPAGRPAQIAPPQAAPVQSAPPERPRTRVANRTPVAEPPAAQPPPRRAAPEQSRQAAVAPAARTPRAKTSGFVTVLGYQKGRMEALKMMADLQQKYAQLQGQKLDVIESDQSARGLGVIYRVVAGPPASRSNAMGLCKQLSDAGFKGCWAMAR